jgi:transcriptional regulator with XRE-family HTH domain
MKLYEQKAKKFINDYLTKSCDRVRDLRMKNRIKQTALIDKINISQACYSRIEKKSLFPQIKVLLKLAALYNVDLNYLAGLTDNPEPLVDLVEQKEQMIQALKTLLEQKEKIIQDKEKIIALYEKKAND